MSARILIVDDEQAIRRLVKAVLQRGGMQTIEAKDGRETLLLLETQPDAAVIDLRLPDIDGMELIPRLVSASIPVLVLSAELDTDEKVAALDLGADDYLTKPFDGDELLARIRVLLRRVGISADGIARHAGIEIDESRHRALVAGEPVALTPREFALLAALVDGQGRVLTHRSLLEKIWGPAHILDLDYLRVAIRSLRRKIESDPSKPTLIINEPGIGYRLGN